MSPNPFEPPRAAVAAAPAGRSMFVLAGIGGFLASGYWALMTLLLGMGVANGSVSGTQIILPLVLIVLYAVRGVQLLKGDAAAVAAAQRILWLHVVGGVFALIYMASGGAIVAVLQGLKVVIHAFGGVTAWLARKSYLESNGLR